MSFRQAGSTMKPLVYLTAMRLGLSLDSPVLDAPVSLPDRGRTKQVSNYDGLFKGEIPLRLALAESRNAATVRLAELVGIPAVVATAHELGIHSELAPYVTTALGASEVTLLELANVYRTFASGARAEPWILRGVLARDGSALYTRPGPQPRPLDDPALPLIQEGLRGTVRLPGATGRSLSALPFAVMGKTGTTNDYRDALFVGSTFGPGGVTMAVRIGFDDNRSLGEGETGGRTALPVFREALTRGYATGALGSVPEFPAQLERGIDLYLTASADAHPTGDGLGGSSAATDSSDSLGAAGVDAVPLPLGQPGTPAARAPDPAAPASSPITR
jgi:penicillin-binding protein 1A